MNLSEELKKIIRGDVETSDETLTKYSHDASIFEIRPEVVVFPKNSEDVKALVNFVRANKEQYPNLSLTPRCAGTDMSGGAIGDSIILDFTRYMNKVISFDDPYTITVQPGMFYRDFEKVTLEKGTILPCYTASRELNAVGGMFGNNSAGERTLSYGKTEDFVVSSKMVFEDGNEYHVGPLDKDGLAKKSGQANFEGRLYGEIKNIIDAHQSDIKKAKPQVHKNSAGYYIWNVERENTFDLNKLLVGSQGTLGIATEITFRLVKPRPYTKLLVVFLRDMRLVPNLVNTILKHKPQTLESYDDKTFLLVLKYIVSFAKLLGLKNLFKLVFSFGPETLMTLRHGFPKLIMLVEFTGDSQQEVDDKAARAYQELKTIRKIGLHIARDDFEAKKYWTIRHEAFNLIRYHLKKVKSMPFIDDVIVRPEMLPEFFPKLYAILEEYKKHVTFAVGGHAGDGNMHIYTLLDPNDSELAEEILGISDRVYALVSELGGSITAEHNDGIIRTPYLDKMFSPTILSVFTQIKTIFDPKNIFNPGKKVGGSKDYLKTHITKKVKK